MMDLRALYEEVILDHNRNPHNYGKKPDATSHSAHGHNPLCGDEVEVHLRIEDGIIREVGFEGQGCAISTASASLMSEALEGKSEEQAKVIFNALHELLTDEDARDDGAQALGKLAVLGGVKQYPMRVKCATLPWHTLHAALRQETGLVTTE